MNAERRLIIVSGLSGAGKSVALHALEDLDYYCVDNLPVSFLPELVRQLDAGELPHIEAAAVGIDSRGSAAAIRSLPGVLEQLEAQQIRPEIVFLDASVETLIKRFSETRRKHPLSSDTVSLAKAIEMERELLLPIAAAADARIDTTRLQLHQLRTQIRELIAQRHPGQLALQLISFGYKNGIPPDADFVFDARCLPNPHWDPILRGLTGRDEPVQKYLAQAMEVRELVNSIAAFLETWIPRFEADDRSYLTVAVGCTGGRHRSVYIAEELSVAMHASGRHVLVFHRDLQSA
ncbi:MAG: RNase adapter RapZ [Gammaproteobacteria bacterium]|nr:RNase adapter RapZ [Gammaproteobacteria bacterium]NNM01184.1 RNase adapter RapZ [Gammaproteobacteria bacterium]